jgi:hypothetical protein
MSSTPDTLDRHGTYNGDADGVIARTREWHAKVPFSMHQVDNMLIEFAGRDVAVVETYGRTIQRYPADGKASLSQLSGGAAGSAE